MRACPTGPRATDGEGIRRLWRETFGADAGEPATTIAVDGEGWLAASGVLGEERLHTACAAFRALMQVADAARAARQAHSRSVHQILPNEVPAGVVVVDTSLVVVTWNRHAEELFGWTAQEAIGRHGSELVMNPNEPKLVDRLADRLAGGEHFSGTYLARRKGGSTVPVAYGWRALHGHDGQVTHYLWVSIDASRQYAAAEVTNRLASIIAATPDLVSTCDPDLRLVSMNPAGRRLLNMSEHDDITRLHVWDFLTPESSALLRDVVLPALDTNDVWTGELEFAWRGGTGAASVVALAHRAPDGTVEYFSALARDISDQRLSQATLRSREAQQAVVAALGRQALETSDLDELFASAVQEVARVLGVPMCGVLECSRDRRRFAVRAVVGVAAPPEVVPVPPGTAADHVLTTGEAVIIEDYSRESRFVVTDLARAIGIASGVSVLIGSVEDPFGVLTADAARPHAFSDEAVDFLQSAANVLAAAVERQRTEEALRRAQRLEALGRLAGGIAHDFNNLLTAILGYLDVIESRAEQLPDIQAAVTEASGAGRSAAALVDQLLTFSRGQEPVPAVADVNEAVGSVTRMLTRIVGGDVSVTTQLAPEPTSVMVAEHQLQQILLNLAVNAKDAMPHGGELRIETTVLPGDKAAAEALGNSGFVGFTVSDTGTGMDAATKARLFEPYFTTKEPGVGTGLGLPTVYGIVTEAGGRVDVATELGTGTSITIWLPMTSAVPVAEPGDVAQTGAAQRRGATVLLVEDQVAVRALVQSVLSDRGHEVLVASNGVEALELVNDGNPDVDLVLTDIVMPRMQGPELVDRLRPQYPDLAVVYMSGYHEQSVLNGSQAERARFLRKPFTLADLIKTVEDLLIPVS